MPGMRVHELAKEYGVSSKEMLDKLKPQIEKWISSCGGPFTLAKSGVTVYLTSIHDLTAGKWAYIYNMEGDEPVCLIHLRRRRGAEPGKE